MHRLEDIWDVRYNPSIYLVLSGGNDKGQAGSAYASDVLSLLWHTRDITDVGDEGEETKEENSLNVATAHRESLPVVTVIARW